MAVKLKNLLYQPIPINDGKDRTVVLKPRENKLFSNLNIKSLPSAIAGLQKQGFIKIKEQ